MPRAVRHVPCCAVLQGTYLSEANLDNALMRFEFLEALLRTAVAKVCGCVWWGPGGRGRIGWLPASVCVAPAYGYVR